ncbi:MAG: type II secretion system GspH family protein [Candidatus Gastranaerophilales bacterium]|nr:type II secretion system GspH family protein [Candidatus Gastranaerophilales bacterium]
MNKGFTLSEILITLGIVGIVAVLTVPGVMKNYQNRLYTAQLEKIYAQLSDAAQAIMTCL